MMKNAKCLERLLSERIITNGCNAQKNIRIVNELHAFAWHTGKINHDNATQCMETHLTIAKVVNSVHRLD